jgi:hypothetical protein
MAKEIRFKISNKTSFAFKYGDYDLTPRGILGKIINLSRIVSIIFIIFSLSFENVNILNGGTVIYSYYFILILIAFQLLKRIIGKGDFFPSYSFDVQILFMMSFIALSLFINTVIFKTGQNIWGEAGMQSISGITMIMYWFMYYLLCLNLGVKGGGRRSIMYMNMAVIAGISFVIINGSSNIAYFADVVILLIPGLIWLTFTQKKLFWYSLIALLITIIMLFWATNYAIFAFFIGIGISTIFQILVYRKNLVRNLKTFFIDFKRVLIKNISFKKFIDKSYASLISIIDLIIIIIGIFWTVFNYSQIGTSNLYTTGYKYYIDGLAWNNITFGRALYGIESTGIFTTIFAYGVLPVLVGFIIIILGFVKMYKFLSKQKSMYVIGRFFALISILITLITFYVVSPLNNSVMIMIWVVIALLAISNELHVNKKQLVVSNEINTYSDVKEESIKEFMQILQKLLIILLIVLLVYGFTLIKSITQYLSN